MTLRHLQPIATVRIVFALILSLLACYLFFEGTLFGLILLGAAFKLAAREGVEIDLDGKRYRKIYAIFAVNLGVWKPLPPITYISIFKTIKNSRARVIAAEANLGFEVYKLNLFYQGNKHIEAYHTDFKEDAFQVATHIATVLEIDILDATNAVKKWL